jgi:NTP pyrophosphatase (non-canonical NTP hydrolase)
MNENLKRVSDDFSNLVKGLTSSEHFYVDDNLLHGVLGIGTEAGEIQDVVKKYMFYGKIIDISNFKAEIGDLLFYVQMVLNYLDSSMEEVMAINSAKLKTRYPYGFNQNMAIVRNKEAENLAIKNVEKEYEK